MMGRKRRTSSSSARQSILHYMTLSLTTLLIITTSVSPAAVSATNGAQNDNSEFQYSRGPVPDQFQVGMHYPSRNETEQCRPIRLRIERDSRLFRTNLVINTNPGISFASSDAKRMTSRLQSRLNSLATMFYSTYQRRFTVLLAWVEYSSDDGVDDPQSLHYEGRTVRVSVEADYVTVLLQLAIEAGFDWVFYASQSYVRLSVIPDVCDANIDMVFMLDQSGSVGQVNHDIALYFLRDVVSFYDISPNATQVGLVTFSSGASIRFDLDDHSSLSSLQYALSRIRYTGGWTTTAFALLLTRQVLNPAEGYGARPFSQGIPKVAVLITDGRSNLYPINEIAPLLRSVGVQVYTVGIGNIYLPELKFIASDPDPLHVYLLDSYNDAPAFVDFLSFTTCDSPAIVEPGDNTTTDVEEDGFRFFQSACPAFSVTIMIEQIDLVGSCSLYASNQIQNPGPLSPQHLIVSNENRRSNRRSVYLSLPDANKFVYVSVRGHATRNHFSVIIWDMIFGEDMYTVSVPEGVLDSNIFDLNQVLRMTNVTFNYTIKDGNEDGFFSLDSQSGVLSVVSPLNADLHDYFLLTIVAQNSNYSCHRGRVKIKIIVLRDGIDFPDLEPVSISENTDVGTPITQAQVIDDDGSILYSIIAGNVGNAFEINSTNGVVSVASSLDFETLQSYMLTIQATSTVTGNTATAPLQIDIEDVNEQPFFTNFCAQSGSCVFTVRENVTAGILVDILTADDPDRPELPNGMLTFSIESMGGFLPFILVQNDRQVEIRTSAVLDHENQSVYNFIARVNDGGTPMLFAVVPVTVNVTDINDNAPVFVQPPFFFSVSEATTPGTVIEVYTATDADSGEFGEIIYTVTSSLMDSLPFAIDPESGELIVNSTLDFEEVNLYTIQVTASNPDGLQSTTITSFVSITDENDNPPVFNDTIYFGNVTEHSPSGTAILTVTASDADSGSNGQIVFSIVSGNFLNLLAIDTIEDGLGVIRVAANADINRELIDVFNLTIRANDLGSPQMEDFAQVVIMVDDINDNAPVFLPSLYIASIREDEIPPTGVQKVFAIDLDQPGSPNSEIDFDIIGGNIGNVFSLNRIDNNNAVLQLIDFLNFETQPSYRLIIRASDRGVPQMNSTGEIIVIITDVNTEPPVVDGNQTVSLSELTPVGTQIARINATDFDSPSITFSITSVVGEGVNGDDALGMFSINDQGVITLDELLDFERSLSYVIEITVTDGMLSSTTSVFISVVDENEFSPIFGNLQPLQVCEELPSGRIVGAAIATDEDRDSIISYSIIFDGPSSSLFTIDSQTGVIRTNQSLDREELVEQDLFLPSDGSATVIRVQAVDSGMPSRFTIAEVMITLEDINDNVPVFDSISDDFEAFVVEERPAGTLVFNALARDLDLGSNGEINYTLEVLGLAQGSMPPFEIDPDTGSVTTTRPLDRESIDFYMVFIQASDGGSPSLSVNATVNVTVRDVNDNAPIFVQPTYELEVLENTFFPQQILQVQADDADSGTDAEITYSIREAIPADSANLFTIDPNNGTISLIGLLDFETRSLHRLVIAADDSINSNTTEVIIMVRNVDETPPEFVGECTASILETFPPGFPVTQCTARDFDDSANLFRAAERYKILSGNTNDTFSIANDGTVTLERNLDREAIPVFIITVQAFDRVGLTNTTQLVININDINDNQPVFENIPDTITITQNEIQSHETNFFTILASDPDFGLNAELVFSLSTNVVSNTITELTITVSDQGSPMMSSTALLTFQYEVPCMLQMHSINASSGEITSQLLCSVSITPTSNDLTFGQDLTLMCNVLRNVEATFEFLHNGSLVTSAIPLAPTDSAGLFSINNATFQDAGEYACKVTAPTVGSLQSSNAVVQIQVPPVVTIPPAEANVELGRSITFSCFATGVPQPAYTWSRQTAQGFEVVDSGARFIVSFNFLVISPIVSGDQGTYTCMATNSAGMDQASAMLTVFGRSSLIVMEIQSFSNPNQDGSCNEFSSSAFEAAMTTITGMRTMTTDVNGTDLCEESACSPSPCQNGGECSLESEVAGGFVCSCSVGYTGINCETDINECADDPCQFGGTCTNTDGSFLCECPPEFTGHRCQYVNVCNGTSNPCPDDQMCVETISNTRGYVCQEISTIGAVVVTGIVSEPGNLDDHVNNIQEMSSQQTSRRRRQLNGVLDNNGFVTTCEARFMPITPEGFALMWACPQGVESPSQEELDEICRALFAMRLVESCSSPTGLVWNSSANATSLSNSTVEVFFILVGDDGVALSGAEALAVLERSDVLARLRGYGYQATGYSAVVPPSVGAMKAAFPTVMVVGVVVALLLAALLSALVFSVVCVVRRRRSNKKSLSKVSGCTVTEIYQLSPNSSLRRRGDSGHTSQENLLEESTYMSLSIKERDTPLELTAAKLQDLFDDRIYGQGYVPPAVITSPENSRTSSPFQRPPSSKSEGEVRSDVLKAAKRSSLERRQGGLVKSPSLRKRTESQDNLLKDDDDDDYEEIIVADKAKVTAATSLSQPVTTGGHGQYRDSEIYSNLPYVKEGGALGNAGERWESYWKTHTLLRTQNQGQSSNGKGRKKDSSKRS